MPAVGGTKMYLLAESLMSNIGAPRWEKFMKELPHIDVVFDQNGVASIRVKKWNRGTGTCFTEKLSQ
jgi:hypothetical protein